MEGCNIKTCQHLDYFDTRLRSMWWRLIPKVSMTFDATCHIHSRYDDKRG